MLMQLEFWVAVAFVIFVLLLAYAGLHRQIVAGLDSRRKQIASELDAARALREEAGSLLADYRRKHHQAQQEAEAITANARSEAERIAAEARARMEELVARRTSIAQAKISQAEAQALADVRAAAADAAVAAAAAVMTESAKGELADKLIARGISDVKAKLN
jgi:F-type H+-transporting ATPase subunit b